MSEPSPSPSQTPSPPDTPRDAVPPTRDRLPPTTDDLPPSYLVVTVDEVVNPFLTGSDHDHLQTVFAPGRILQQRYTFAEG